MNKDGYTWESVLRFMQEQDKNGSWSGLERTPDNVAYVVTTLTEWLDDGLELTPRIFGLRVWLIGKYEKSHGGMSNE